MRKKESTRESLLKFQKKLKIQISTINVTIKLVKEKGLAPILIIIVVAVLLVGGYFIWSSYSNNRTEPTPVNQTAQVNNPSPTPNLNQNLTDPKQILGALQRSINVTAPIKDRNNIDWIDQYKQRIPLTGLDFGIGTEANDYMGKYGNYAQYGDPNFLRDVTEESLKPLQTQVDKFFVSKGFQKNELNTFRAVNPVYFSMGYTENDLKCLINLGPNGDPIGNFFCGVIDTQQISWRKELTPIINNTNDPNTEVSVTKLLGNYASGGVGTINDGGGAAWFAVKVDGKWKQVWTGQNIISCTPVKQYNIPKEIYGDDCSTNY